MKIHFIAIIAAILFAMSCSRNQNEIALIGIIANPIEAIDTEALSLQFENELVAVKGNNNVLIGRSTAMKYIQAKNYSLTGLSDDEAIEALRAGKSGKAVIARVSYWNDRYAVILKVLDIDRGSILFIDKVEAWTKPELPGLMPILANRTFRKLSGESLADYELPSLSNTNLLAVSNDSQLLAIVSQVMEKSNSPYEYETANSQAASSASSVTRVEVSVAASSAPTATVVSASGGENVRETSFNKDLAALAVETIGNTSVPMSGGKSFNNDASGYIGYLLSKGGIEMSGLLMGVKDSGNLTQSIFIALESKGWAYTANTPRTVGDLVFFDNTYDANKNGQWDDLFTYLGVVTRIDGDGTVYFTAFSGSKGVKEYKINLANPDDNTRNSYLRGKGAENYPNSSYFSSGLFHAWGHIEK